MKEDIFAAIAIECDNQRRAWGEQDHTNDMWAVILGEEYGEACEAILKGGLGNKALKSELVQIAAVAVSWLRCIRRREAAVNE